MKRFLRVAAGYVIPIVVVAAVIGFVVFAVVATDRQREERELLRLHIEAAAHGAGKWVTGENGEPEFRWNDERGGE